MNILAIDTSCELCLTAILEKDKVIDENNLDNGKTHSENLMPLIQELLSRNKLDVKNINLIACSVGPGSFTGIRIGVASIKSIAEVLNIPVASVTSLEILASNIDKEDATKVSLIDAKNNQVYCGIFDGEKEEYFADDINVIIDKIKIHKNIICVGNGAVLHRELLKEKINNMEFADNNKQSAVNTGIIGYNKFLNNNLKDADTIAPIYLRKSQAEIKSKKG